MRGDRPIRAKVDRPGLSGQETDQGRVTFVCDYFFRDQSPMDEFFIELGKRFVDAARSVSFLLPVRPVVTAEQKLLGEEFQVRVFDCWRRHPLDSKSKRNFMHLFLAFRRTDVLSESCVIHFFFTHAIFVLVTSAWLRLSRKRCTLIYHHRNEVRVPQSKLRHAITKHVSLLRLASFFLDAVVAVYEQGRRNLVDKGIPKRKAFCIPNGIKIPRDGGVARESGMPPKRPAGIPEDGTMLLFVGQIIEWKGVRELLQATATVLERFPEVHLVCVGDGPMLDTVRELATELGIQETVTWTGRRKDVPAIMRAADVFLSPSYSEGSPKVILEAGLANLPVVATAVGGTPEIVADGRSGYLVPPRDAGALADAICRMLSDMDRAREMGLELGKTVRTRYRWEDCINHHYDLTMELMETH